MSHDQPQGPQGLVHYPGLRVELDITPEWFVYGEHVFEDQADIARAFGLYEGEARRLADDLAVGRTGARLVLLVPPNNPTDAFEAERLVIRRLLDALAITCPRRARIVAQRRAAAAAAAKAEQERQKAAADAEAEAAQQRAADAENARLEAEVQAKRAAAEAPPRPLEVLRRYGVAGGTDETLTLFADLATGQRFEVSDGALLAVLEPPPAPAPHAPPQARPRSRRRPR